MYVPLLYHIFPFLSIDSGLFYTEPAIIYSHNPRGEARANQEAVGQPWQNPTGEVRGRRKPYTPRTRAFRQKPRREQSTSFYPNAKERPSRRLYSAAPLRRGRIIAIPVNERYLKKINARRRNSPRRALLLRMHQTLRPASTGGNGGSWCRTERNCGNRTRTNP
jgi:hypothetical protein